MTSRFIVLEGPDGSGTTSQSQLLAAALKERGADVLLTAEPTDGVIGKYIRSQLEQGMTLSPASLQLLFSADRATHVDTIIKPALAAGKTVICDRYLQSTLVYGQAAGVEKAWLESVNATFPKPDTLIYLLPPFEVCMERIGQRAARDAFEKESFQSKVHALYTSLAKGHPHVVDSSGAKSDTARLILACV